MLGSTLKGYIWRKEWCWPYESAWGVLEKFKYANALDNQVFDKLLNLRGSSYGQFFLKDLYMYRKSRLDSKLFFSTLNIANNHFRDLDIFLGNNPNVIFREDIYFCPKCIELGYHSYWHQVKMITNCPFHGEKLKVATYNERTIKYSILSLRTEAFSSMHDRKTIPVERFAQILPSRVLIDGPWDNISKEISFPQVSLERLIFYNPFFDNTGIMKQPQDCTYDFMYQLLLKQDIKIKPILKISLEKCEQRLSNIIEQAKQWFESRYMLYNHYQVGAWYITSLIETLTSPYTSEEISDAMRNLRKLPENNDKFIDVASALLTAYNASNSRTLGEALDHSLILKPSTHNVRRNMFSLDEMEQFITKESSVHQYINYFIYERLFNLLHQQIRHLLTHSNKTNFDYQDRIPLNIPDYVITLQESLFEIYELNIDN